MNLNEKLMDLQIECEEKDESIKKAQKIIQKLNDECEKTIRDLQASEQENAELKAKLKFTDKQITDANLKVNDYDKMLQTQNRLRDEIQGLKKYQDELIDHQDDERDKFNSEIDALKEDKDQLESIIHQLEAKLDQIMDQNQVRDSILDENAEKVKMYEETLKSKDKDLSELLAEYEKERRSKDEEIEEIKSTAANTIRNLYDQQKQDSDNKKKLKIPSKLSEKDKKILEDLKASRSLFHLPSLDSIEALKSNSTAINLLKQILLDSKARECEVTHLIEEMCKLHAEKMIADGDKVKKQKERLTEEVERLLMRNEELEQRLLNSQQRVWEIKQLYFEAEKLIKALHQSNCQEIQCSDDLRSELLSGIEFMVMELEAIRTKVLDEILPEAADNISKLFDTSIKKVNCMNNIMMKRDKEIATKEDEKERFLKDREDLEIAHSRLSDDLYSKKQDLQRIESMLFDEEYDTPEILT